MKDAKYAKGKSAGLLSSVASLKRIHSLKGLNTNVTAQYKNVAVMVTMLFTFLLLLGPGPFPSAFSPKSIDDGPSSLGSRKSLAWKALMMTGQNVSFSLGPRIVNLDARRKNWWKANPTFRSGRPKLLIVSGSQPTSCERSIDTHMLLKTAKNKVHFSRMHDFQLHYTLVEPNSELTGSWAKLSVLRMLMVSHPEVEWFWWMDADTVVTDMEFNVPLEKYRRYNFVIYGDKHRVFRLKDWQGLSSSNFLIRNCDWAIRFLDTWGSMGQKRNREQVGKFLSKVLHGRPIGVDADEQSALVYILATEKIWASKAFLEHDIPLTSDWNGIPIRTNQTKSRGGVKTAWPVVTRFSGCFRCDSSSSFTMWPWEQCQTEMERVMDFADNQMYREYGYQFREFGVPLLDPIPGHKVKGVVVSASSSLKHSLGSFHGFPIHKLPGPPLKDWDAQRQKLQKNPKLRPISESGRPKMMIVTGSSTKECNHPEGAHILLQALKNKVDYSRFHDIRMFYGMVDFDRDLDYWWTKIPTIRILMLAHPDVEWFWWCDGDAVITDMIFDFPYEKYNDKNLVLYGDDELVYEKHDWIGLNAGVYLVRNCQWTLDLFDAWAALGVPENQVEAGKIQSKIMPGRPDNVADDQSSLLYMLMTDEEKAWSPFVCLERSITISGYWKMVAPRFENMKATSHPGLGNADWPWITHFAGCQPCGLLKGNFDSDECRLHNRRAHGFADDQVLALYGLEHVSLESQKVQPLRSLPTSSDSEQH